MELSKTVKNFCDNQGIIKNWPVKYTAKLELLDYLASKVPYQKIFTEKEINEIIKLHHSFNNHVELRRSLIDYRFFHRDRYCRNYWKGHRELEAKIKTANLSLENELLEDNQTASFRISKKIFLASAQQEIGSIRLELGIPDDKTVLIARLQIEDPEYKAEVISEISKRAGRQGIEYLMVETEELLECWAAQGFQEVERSGALVRLKKELIA